MNTNLSIEFKYCFNLPCFFLDPVPLDPKRSVFIGNLPFTVDEEEVRGFFSDRWHITKMRIVRDPMTLRGKGICLLEFRVLRCVIYLG